jgi:hypothetical protein
VKVNKETVKESVVIASLSGPGSSPERLWEADNRFQFHKALSSPWNNIYIYNIVKEAFEIKLHP